MKRKDRDSKFKEYQDATNALLDWLQSQDIEPIDAVPVLAIAIAALVTTLAGGAKNSEHAKLALNMIRDTIKSMEEMK